LTLLNAQKREGVKKDGTKYMFYSVSFLDSESNVLKMNLGDKLNKDTVLTGRLENAHQVPVVIDLALYQTGFNLKGTVVKIDF
jgi:hypothetical protein